MSLFNVKGRSIHILSAVILIAFSSSCHSLKECRHSNQGGLERLDIDNFSLDFFGDYKFSDGREETKFPARSSFRKIKNNGDRFICIGKTTIEPFFETVIFRSVINQLGRGTQTKEKREFPIYESMGWYYKELQISESIYTYRILIRSNEKWKQNLENEAGRIFDSFRNVRDKSYY